MNLCDSRKRIWYLSGGMTKFGVYQFDESNNWRVDIKDQIRSLSDGYIVGFSPNEHWNMRDDIYGFKALENRYTVLNKTPSLIPDDKKIDLSKKIF